MEQAHSLPVKSINIELTLSKNKTEILVNKEIRQVGALCFQITPEENPKILLITSRRSQRWIIPKGWPIKGLKSYKVAEQEAFEEAGALGTTFDICLGSYSYIKKLDQGLSKRIVYVYPLKVENLISDYDEAHERSREWFNISKAKELLSEPGLKDILTNFKPKLLLNAKYLRQ